MPAAPPPPFLTSARHTSKATVTWGWVDPESDASAVKYSPVIPGGQGYHMLGVEDIVVEGKGSIANKGSTVRRLPFPPPTPSRSRAPVLPHSRTPSVPPR